MKVLVCAASKHGATAEIATRIAGMLTEAGLDTDVTDPAAVTRLDGYDAVVLGSAVYAGRWLAPARSFVAAWAEQLASIPVWLFSSGPVGDPPLPREEQEEAAGVAARIGARQHTVFAGKLDKASLGVAERVIVRAMRVPDGDFRDWADIDTWATQISLSLAPASGRGPERTRR